LHVSQRASACLCVPLCLTVCHCMSLCVTLYHDATQVGKKDFRKVMVCQAPINLSDGDVIGQISQRVLRECMRARHTHTHTHVHVHVHIHIHIHTHIHTHIHMHICTNIEIYVIWKYIHMRCFPPPFLCCRVLAM